MSGAHLSGIAVVPMIVLLLVAWQVPRFVARRDGTRRRDVVALACASTVFVALSLPFGSVQTVLVHETSAPVLTGETLPLTVPIVDGHARVTVHKYLWVGDGGYPTGTLDIRTVQYFPPSINDSRVGEVCGSVFNVCPTLVGDPGEIEEPLAMYRQPDGRLVLTGIDGARHRHAWTIETAGAATFPLRLAIILALSVASFGWARRVLRTAEIERQVVASDSVWRSPAG